MHFSSIADRYAVLVALRHIATSDAALLFAPLWLLPASICRVLFLLSLLITPVSSIFLAISDRAERYPPVFVHTKGAMSRLAIWLHVLLQILLPALPAVCYGAIDRSLHFLRIQLHSPHTRASQVNPPT